MHSKVIRFYCTLLLSLLGLESPAAPTESTDRSSIQFPGWISGEASDLWLHFLLFARTWTLAWCWWGTKRQWQTLGPSVEWNGEMSPRKGSCSSCPTLCDPMDCSPPGSSIHGIFQARMLEWVAISFSRRSSQPRDWTRVSCIVGNRVTMWATSEVLESPGNGGERTILRGGRARGPFIGWVSAVDYPTWHVLSHLILNNSLRWLLSSWLCRGGGPGVERLNPSSKAPQSVRR